MTSARPARPSPLFLRAFTWHARRSIAKRFHTLRVSKRGWPFVPTAQPVVAFTNHASWWDPLTGLALKAELFPGRTLFAPMDQAMLSRYGIFKKLGFFGVEQHTRRGAAQFLRQADEILREPNSLLAVTPQARFADVRERPARFAGGLGHLATRVNSAVFLPAAIEYVFWEESCAEILVQFGPPINVVAVDPGKTADEWTHLFESALAGVQDTLAGQARRRNPADFQVILGGSAGQGGVYDAWQALKAFSRGAAFSRKHGQL